MKVYLTYRNADMTEGRGPMVPDRCFSERVFAEHYIDVQPGVMGRRCRWSQEKFGDWEVREIEVINYDLVEAEELRRSAVASERMLSVN